MGSPLKKELKLDNDNLTIIATSPNGVESTIVEQPAAKPGDAVLTGERANSGDSDKTAKPAEVDTAKANDNKDKDEDKASEETESVPETPTTESNSNGPSAAETKKKANGSKRRKGKNRK